MDKDEQRRRDEELDRFWDIDELIPKPRSIKHRTADTEATEIVSAAPTSGKEEPRAETIPPRDDSPRPRFIPPHTADEMNNRPTPDEEYTPENALIRKVRLFRRSGDYRYYESFVRDAERLYAVRGAECLRVSFFSYVPQYTQMSRQQLQWYLWWRENTRQGRFLDTDYSYILLYVYELINLSHKTDAARSQAMLFALWREYRALYRQLDGYLPEWICDFSLIHRLPPPADCEGALLAEIMSRCTLKEFYVSSRGEDIYVGALLAFCSNYDYRKSKFYTGERRELFERAVVGALKRVLRATDEHGQPFSRMRMDDSHLTRDAFSGALCAHSAKRRIEVEYCSFSRSHELRYFITDVIKYTENRLRAYFAIRSKLSIYALPTSIRELLDGYLDELLPKRVAPTPTSKSTEPPAYEKLYDLPKKEFSLSDAAEIERLSWDTTERLVEAFSEEAEALISVSDTTPLKMPPPSASLMPTPASTDASTADGQPSLVESLAPYRTFLRAVKDGDLAAQAREATLRGLPLDVLADEVNAASADAMGDVLLEPCGDGYAVIEDYLDLLDPL